MHDCVLNKQNTGHSGSAGIVKKEKEKLEMRVNTMFYGSSIFDQVAKKPAKREPVMATVVYGA